MTRISPEKMKKLLQVYFIVGSNNCKKNPAAVLTDAIEGGVTLFQFREKGTGARTGLDKLELAKDLQQICRKHRIPFLVNDDVDLALQIDADGVHVGQDDESVETVRERIGDKILGVSAHSIEEAELAIAQGADYLGVGPVFPTTTKEDAREAAGFTLIQQLRSIGCDVPIVGIGGINSSNCASVIEVGADGVSVISAISGALSITKAARELRAQVKI